MHPYLERTRYATETLITAIFHEEEALAGLSRELGQADALLANLADGIHFLGLNPDLDDEGLGAMKTQESWMVEDRAYDIRAQIHSLTQSIADKRESTTALCGALLQIAKRGITSATGPQMVISGPGRLVSGLPLERIIWEGRNQSMHHESPLREAGRLLFAHLAGQYYGHFDAGAGRDLAREVINLLGWSNLATYVADMESILPAVVTTAPTV
jgi:hypothetical protein